MSPFFFFFLKNKNFLFIDETAKRIRQRAYHISHKKRRNLIVLTKLAILCMRFTIRAPKHMTKMSNIKHCNQELKMNTSCWSIRMPDHLHAKFLN